ncbi:Anoctamin-like protein [Diplonema papillatum]|nr:Anoctamin-like protein [Diplonema papillatum]
MEAVCDQIVEDIVRLLNDVFCAEPVFDALAKLVVVPDVVCHAVSTKGRHGDDFALAVVQISVATNQRPFVDASLLANALRVGHYKTVLLLAQHAGLDTLHHAFSSLRFKPLCLEHPRDPVLMPPCNRTVFHLAVLLGEIDFVVRLLSVPQCIPREVLSSIFSFVVMHAPAAFERLMDVCCPLALYAEEEPRKWGNDTRLSPLHWALVLPKRAKLVPKLLLELGPNDSAAAHLAAPVLGAPVRNWAFTEKADVFWRAAGVRSSHPVPGVPEDPQGVIEAVHPVALPVAFLSPKIPPMHADERVSKLQLVLGCPGVVLEMSSVIFTLECILRRRLWEAGAAKRVITTLFNALPAGAKVPLHHALPTTNRVSDAEVRACSNFVSVMVEHFPSNLDYNAVNEIGLAPVHTAAYHGMALALEALFSNGDVDVSARCSAGFVSGTALSIAVAHASMEAVAVILRHPVAGAPAALAERSLDTRRGCLHEACSRLDLQTVLLLAERAPPAALAAAAVPSQNTPLHLLFLSALKAVEPGPNDSLVAAVDSVATTLLQPKLLHLANAHGDTTVHLALRVGCVDFIRAAAPHPGFLSAASQSNAKGETVYHCVARSTAAGAAAAVAVLRDAYPVDVPALADRRHRTVLHVALGNRCLPGALLAALWALFPAGAPAALGVFHGCTALAAASAVAQLDPAELETLCVPSAATGRNALHGFAAGGDTAALAQALARHPQPAAAVACRDGDGDTVVHLLAAAGDAHATKIVRSLPPEAQARVLLAKGAGGNGVLHRAAPWPGLFELVELAVSAFGADRAWCFANEAGATPAQVALEAGRTEAAWWLWVREKTRGGVDAEGRNVLLQAAAAPGGVELFCEMLRAVRDHAVDLDVWSTDRGKNNIVHAMVSDPERAADKLVLAGETLALTLDDYNECNASGDTPLRLAVRMGHADAVHLLLGAGAVYSARDMTLALDAKADDVVATLLHEINPSTAAFLAKVASFCSAETGVMAVDSVPARESPLAAGRALDALVRRSTLKEEEPDEDETPAEHQPPTPHSNDAVVSKHPKPASDAPVKQPAALSRHNHHHQQDNEELFKLLFKTLALLSTPRECHAHLVLSAERWLAAQSTGDAPSFAAVDPLEYAQVIIELRSHPHDWSAGGQPALFLFFSFILVGHLLRLGLSNVSFAPLYTSCASLPAVTELPSDLQARCPAVHKCALLLFSPEADRTALLRDIHDHPAHAFAVYPLLFYLPSCAPLATLCDDLRLAHYRKFCQSFPCSELAILQGGTAEQLSASLTIETVPDGFLAAFSASRHAASADLLRSILDLRPAVSPGLVSALRDRGLLEKVNSHGDTALHLVVMADDPSVVPALAPAECDFAARNAAGLRPVDYCKSGAMMKALVRLTGHPPLSSIAEADYVLCLSPDVKPQFWEDPATYLVDRLYTCFGCHGVALTANRCFRGSDKRVIAGTADDALAHLEDQLTAQRVIIHKSPAAAPPLWALQLPHRRAVELAADQGTRTGGHGEGTEAVDSLDFVEKPLFEEVVRLTVLQRIRMMQVLLNPFESQIDLVELKEDNVVHGAFPVYQHDKKAADDVFQQYQGLHPFDGWRRWFGFSKRVHTRKLTDLRDYTGEAYAFYFAWISCYEVWLLLVIPFAVYGTVVQLYVGYSTPLHAFYAMAAMTWSVLYVKNWQRREADLGVTWEVYLRPRHDCPRATFRAAKDEDTGALLTEPNSFDPTRLDPYFPPASRQRRYIFSLLVSAVFVAVATAEFMLFVFLRSQLQTTDSSMSPSESSPGVSPGSTPYPDVPPEDAVDDAGDIFYLTLLSIGHSVVIMFLETLYRAVADALTEFENHKYATSYTQSVMLKYMVLQLANALVPPLYIVYYDSDRYGSEKGFRNASIHVSSKLALEIVLGFLREYLLPHARGVCGSRAAASKQVMPEVTKAWAALVELARKNYGEGYGSEDFRESYAEFSEMVVQFAYVVCFAGICPWAAVIALVNNAIEIRGDLYKLLKMGKRTLPRKAHGIGVWGVLVKFVVALSGPTNAFCLVQSDKVTGEIRYDNTAAFLTFACSFWGAFWLVDAIYPSASYRTSDAIRKQEAQRDSRLPPTTQMGSFAVPAR